MASHRKVVFFSPGFHTGMSGWMRSLTTRGREVEAWTLFDGPDDTASPVALRRLGYAHLWRFLAFGRDRDADDKLSLRFGAPSLSGAIRTLRKSGRPELLVIHDESGLATSCMVILGLLARSRIVLYTQAPKFRARASLFRRFASWLQFDLLHLNALTPVLGREEPGAWTHPRIRYLPFSVAPDATEADVDRRALKTPLVLVTGRFSPCKNHRLAIDALATVETALRPRMILAGTCVGPEETRYLESLKARVEELGIERYVEFRANESAENMAKLYRDASLFILPSLCEKAALPPLEAMARGIPVLSTTENGTNCYLHPGRDGDVFDPRDPVVLGHLVRDWTASTEILRRTGREALKSAAALYAASDFAAYADSLAGNPQDK
jgi:glycosyltransferase involved in cell wall biosynthesis